jgi:hypothetical protein
MAKEFQKPADPISEPAQSDMGASVINYGEQRNVAADGGEEGSKALSTQIGNGGIGSNSKSEE